MWKEFVGPLSNKGGERALVEAGPMTTQQERTVRILERVLGRFSSPGVTPADIAQMLRDYGYKGLPLHSEECPMARFLTRALRRSKGGRVQVGLTDREITVYAKEGRVDYPTPPAVAAFIQAFDNGAYPYLVDVRVG